MDFAPLENRRNKPSAWRLDHPTSTSETEAVLFNSQGFQKVAEVITGQDGLPPVDAGDRPAGGMHRYIVKIESRFENSKTGLSIWKIGTGWLIRSDLLVTAGDVVYDTEYQLGGATQVKCYIGYRGRTSPENSQIQPRYGRRVVTSSEWIDEVATSSRDIAFIQVAEPFAIDICTCKALEDVKIDEPKPVSSFPRQEESAIPVIAETEEKISLTVTHCTSCGESCNNSAVVPVEEPAVQEEVKPDDVPFITPSVNIETDFEIIQETPVASDTTSEVEEIAPVVEAAVETVEASTTTSEFYEVLKTVASIDTESGDADSHLLGSVSSSASVSAGALLSYVVGADVISTSAPTKIHGAAERALLAEASLQAVLAIEESAELDEILSHMEQNWNENAPKVDEAAGLLLPFLKDSAKGVALFDSADINEKAAQPAKRKRLPVGNIHIVGADGVGKDFTTGLFGPTRPLSGRKEVFNSLVPVLKSAVEAVEQLVSRSGSTAVAEWVPKLLQKAATSSTSLAPISTGPDYEASRILLQRAIMADAALQAIASLSQQKLQAIKLIDLDLDHVDEDIFDFIKRLVQEIGPLAVSPAKHAVKKFVRLFIEAPPKLQPVEHVSVKPAPSKLVLRQLLRGNKATAKVL
ncbi:hypothetical protein B0J13DRAFT_644776 [Dactylonectria estremocensis]|uniref:Uncharacterized protein n=1 Tax=Dactylonectria estremocensis TaxID=1079267 RepID=A0A9P9E4G8_9HYPO|nr:hypothetical protein B0J13DRAFT_644776 [Dactylonectria estremocensis]